MAKSAQETEQEFLATIVEQTGKDLDAWMALLEESGQQKTNAIIKHLKSTYGLNHLQATILTGVYLNEGQPVYDYKALFAKLFQGKEEQLPFYRKVESLVQTNMPVVQMIPTKTYVSVDGERCFATVKIKLIFINQEHQFLLPETLSAHFLACHRHTSPKPLGWRGPAPL